MLSKLMLPGGGEGLEGIGDHGGVTPVCQAELKGLRLSLSQPNDLLQ